VHDACATGLRGATLGNPWDHGLSDFETLWDATGNALQGAAESPGSGPTGGDGTALIISPKLREVRRPSLRCGETGW